MKKSGILTAFVSAVMTMAALTCTASAGYIKEGDVPLIDTKPTVKGEIHEEYMTEAQIGHVYRYYYDENGKKVTGKELLYVDYSSSDSFSYNMKMVRLDPETGEFKGVYTGFAKNSRGRSYYKNGSRIYGWYKVGNSWYHFNEKGYADTGRVKICGAYYTFDEKGKWLKKVSKNGLAPEDFTLEISNSLSSFSTDGYIYYGFTMEPDMHVEKNVKFLSSDRQIFYCMFLESGFLHGGEYTFGSEYASEVIDEYLKNDQGYDENMVWSTGSEPVVDYVTTVSYGGKTTRILYNFDSMEVNHIDGNALSAYRLTSALNTYRNNYLYVKYPKPEGDYLMLD